jgi:DNA-directed RNA polymerase specialized sigma24 family protein
MPASMHPTGEDSGFDRHATESPPTSFYWCDAAARSDPIMNRRDEEVLAFALSRRSSLLRTSTALTGGDLDLAEDLVQKCMIKLYISWSRFRSMHVDRYARRALVNALIDERRGRSIGMNARGPNRPTWFDPNSRRTK